MPTSFIDLEWKGALLLPWGLLLLPSLLPLCRPGNAGERLCLQQGKGSPRSPWDRSGAGMSLPPSGEHRVGQVAVAPCAEALCRAERRGAHLTSAMAKSPTFSILNYN